MRDKDKMWKKTAYLHDQITMQGFRRPYLCSKVTTVEKATSRCTVNPMWLCDAHQSVSVVLCVNRYLPVQCEGVCQVWHLGREDPSYWQGHRQERWDVLHHRQWWRHGDVWRLHWQRHPGGSHYRQQGLAIYLTGNTHKMYPPWSNKANNKDCHFLIMFLKWFIIYS